MSLPEFIKVTTLVVVLTIGFVLSRNSLAVDLETVARSPDYAMNGVSVTKEGRVFVSIPQWTSAKSLSVAEILADGTIRPYPGGHWNDFDPAQPMDRFVNVNAVHSDGAGSLWVVNYAGPNFGPSVDGAQKLVRIDLATNQVKRVYRFDETILPKGARLNDVRVDARRGVAYLSEFGIGAIIVLDIESGLSFRAMAPHWQGPLERCPTSPGVSPASGWAHRA